ncbi:MAG TPA: hypothetical protein DCG44_05015 [Candidatus Aquiluna sp.]|jgi:hypothetical protein|nr:hypothetical protein [Aquiluna sp.]
MVNNRNELQMHAGLHKTGTTSIQASLRELGMLSPCRRSDFRDPDSFEKVVNDAAENSQVLSNEHILGEMADLYALATQRLNQIAQFGRNVRVFVYLRPHPEWHASVFSQLIQQGSFRSADAYFETISAQRNLSLRFFCQDLLSASASTLRLEVRVAADVVRDFGKRIGIPLKPGKRANQSLSPFALVALATLSESAYAPHHALRVALVDYARETFGRFSIFSHSQQNYLKSLRTDWIDTLPYVSNGSDRPAASWCDSYEKANLPNAFDFFGADDLKKVERYLETRLAT